MRKSENKKENQFDLLFLKNSYMAIQKLTTPVQVINISAKGLNSLYVCIIEIANPNARASNRNSILSRVFNLAFFERGKYLFYQVGFEFLQIFRQLFSQYSSSEWKPFQTKNTQWSNSEKIRNTNSYLCLYQKNLFCQSKFQCNPPRS